MMTRGQHRATRSLPAWGSSRVLRVVVSLLVVVGLVFAGYGAAYAYVTSTGTDTATGTVGTLNPATAVTGSQVPFSSTVQVSWTAPTTGAVPTGYYVERTPSPSGPVAAACGTSFGTPTISATCNDTSVPVGSYTYVVVALYATWTATSAPSAVVNVLETTQSITFTSSPSSPAVNGTYLVTATGGGSGNPVTFTSATPAVCTVIASTVTFVGAGSCTINANQAGNAQYNAAPQVQQNFAVAKATQTINYTSAAPSGAVVGGAGYTPTATGGGSGNPVAFSIDGNTSTNCSISGGGVVTYQHVGTCTVNADQAGNTNYFAANTLQQSYAIGQGSQAISFTSTAPVNAKVSGSTYNVTAAGGASGNSVTFSSGSPAVCTVVGSTVSFVAAGTCLVNANQAGNTDYLAASQVQQSFGVTKQDQNITFTSTAPSNAKNQGATYNVTATASSGLTVVLTVDAVASTVCALSGSTVSFIGAGTCVINANQVGNGTYNAAPQAQQSFTVAKGDQTISFTSTAPVTATNQGATYNVTATASSGLTVALTVDASASSVCALSGSTVSFIGAGACVINANQVGNLNYNAAPQAQQSFAVAKANQTISFTQPTTPATATTSAALTFSSDSGLTVAITPTDATVCSVVGSTVNYLKAGSCILTATQGGNTNFNAATPLARTVTVNLASQTITFNQPTTPVIAGTSATVSPTSTSGLNVALTTTSLASICTVTGGPMTYTVNYIGAGPCVLNANQAGDAVYAAATQVQRTVTINLAPQTITFNQPTTPANAGTSVTLASLGATATSGLAVTYTISGTSTSACAISGANLNYGAAAGTCVINANQAGNGTYSAAPQVQRTVAVQAADTVAPTISNIMSGRAGLTWQNDTNGNNSWNQDACGGNKLCATITDTGTPTSGVNAATITFSLVGLTGGNAGKCFQSSTSTFVAGPCTITTTFASNVATATVPQNTNIMLNGTYTFTITVSDNAGNPQSTSVTLTIT